MMMMNKRILLVAGGTGGHIWPAVSFGKWLEVNEPQVRVDYVCGNRELEKNIYSAAECEPFILPLTGSPLSGNMMVKLRRTKDFFKAFKDARSIIERVSPDFVLLFGGYVSFPMLVAAMLAGVPVALHEQNAYAGKVTRFAALMNIPVFSGWEDCMPLAETKFRRTGVPIRKFHLVKQSEAWTRLGFNEPFPFGIKVVVFTGSLGSSTVKDIICQIAQKEYFRNWNFILPAVAETCEKLCDNVYVTPKIWNTEILYSLADMAVVRAGGSSLTEVGSLGIVSCVIPWEKAADNHQFHNAVAFVSENAALIWDGKDKAQFEKKLLKLEKLADEKEAILSSKLYNSADKISATLWAAILSKCLEER